MVVREGCKPAAEGRVGRSTRAGAQQVSAAHLVWSTDEAVCLLLPELHHSSTRVIRVLQLVNFREVKRVKVKVFEELLKTILREVSDPLS